jgi:hypothetical protein
MLLKSNIQLRHRNRKFSIRVIKALKKVSGQELPYKIVGRREETLLRLMLIQIKQILFLDGNPVFWKKLWRAPGNGNRK